MLLINYSIVTSVYNDGIYAKNFCEEITRIMSNYLKIPKNKIHNHLEIIIVNDGSKDDSLNLLKEIKEKCKALKIVSLSRNFGQHAALTCAYKIAKGDFIIRSNIDRQDPLTEIPKLLYQMKKSKADIIVGNYKIRNSNLIIKLTSFLYYKFFKIFTGLEVRQNESPLRVMNRKFIDNYNKLNEKLRFPQGIDQWLGFKHSAIEIPHKKNLKKSSYNFYSRFKLGLSSLIYFSDRPLIISGFLGLSLSLIGFISGLIIIITRLTSGFFIPGYASVICILLFGFGLQLIFTGLLGLYIGKIFNEVKDRPLYIISSIYD